MTGDPDPRDWRLVAEVPGAPHAEGDDGHHGRLLDGLLELLRDGGAHAGGAEKDRGADYQNGLAGDMQAAIGDEVVVTHDGRLLFAYAQTRESIVAARRTLDSVLAREGMLVNTRVSHWDEQHGLWAQTDPPPGAEAASQLEQLERHEDVVETRTLVANSGRLDRAEFERSMTRYAAEIGLQCEIVEHPHLLVVQVGFKLTGTRHKIDEFAAGMRAYGAQSVRTELAIAASPL